MMKKFTVLAILVLALAFAVAIAPTAEAAPPGPTIVDVALAANGEGGAFEGQFDTLIAALLASDPTVINTLSGNGQFTVFAPTDDAFAELGLTPDNVGDVTSILLYHVARGNRNAASVTGSQRIRTLNGGFLAVDGAVLTDMQGRDANIIVTDITLPANGIIHAIDRVVLP